MLTVVGCMRNESGKKSANCTMSHTMHPVKRASNDLSTLEIVKNIVNGHYSVHISARRNVIGLTLNVASKTAPIRYIFSLRISIPIRQAIQCARSVRGGRQ
jgi:hypothetical protein